MSSGFLPCFADLVAGYKADLTVLVPDAEKLPKVSISDGDALEEFLADSCPDSLVPVLMAAQALYTSWKLQGMLSYAPGKSLSHNQVAQHDVYGKQLRMLKDLALKYVAKQDANGNVDEDGFKDYVRFFGGPKREDGYRYDKVQVKKQDSPKNNMYARGLAKTAKEKFVRIVRARVLKNTMIELYGERFRIAGEKQVYPVRQMPLAIDEVYLLKGVETIAAAGNAGASAKIDFEKAAESLVGFWDLLLEKLPVNYPKLTVQLKLGSLKHPKDILAATSESEFPAIVYKIAEAEIQVMEQASGLRNMSDTKILGGNTFGGSLVFTFNKVLNDPKSKACFIDTTPAGLHEVKTKIW